ncbi:phosphatase PAP2 family protein [Adlercreutzia sp. R25]|uniref:phosphatase PAP2 family protein n=1 Tax=Adlercreutzia shanghongiae TaxID=3111773 RepID=UPI002DBB9998|nr:phosphatase PAP2 family protein [Adlercreutzia sp. R25]MEC4271911.1 phosphatase PAP2 family protein [Adlercreutzia sp. R25]
MNELAVLDAIQLMHTPWLNSVVAAYTSTSNAGQIWILLGLVLALIPKTRRLGIAVLVALVIGAVITSGIIKPLLMRPRPCDVNPFVDMIVPRPHGSSFPSGHTTAAFAAFGALLFSKGPRPLVIAVGIAAALMAFTRLYCYVHYPTDVLAGLIVGLLAGLAAAKIVESIVQRRHRKRESAV